MPLVPTLPSRRSVRSIPSLLDADDDWIESFRRVWYPRLHPYLTSIPGPVPFYSLGHVGPLQDVGWVSIDEEEFEEILVDLGFQRNPIACFKSDPHDHLSEGSWVLRVRDDEFDLLEPGMQLHITLFASDAGDLEIFAHVEDDWRVSPIAHLRGDNFRPVMGRTHMRSLLDEHTSLDVQGGRQPAR